MSSAPEHLDRLIVHQIDLARSSPGGIDTCLRGLAKYGAGQSQLAFVGVDTGAGPSNRKLGVWERYDFGAGPVWFLPVVKLDPGNQRRVMPHSLRLGIGLVRFLRQLPKVDLVQAHRMDTGFLISALLRKPLVYMVHTQRGGLTGSTSDSLWKYARKVHEQLEKVVVRKAADVVVFNEEYANLVKSWNRKARFSPTWWDPELVVNSQSRVPNKLCWVGRLEVPKDPKLALDVLAELVREEPDRGWSLSVLGSGTLENELKKHVDSLAPLAKEAVELAGRVEPSEVALRMGAARTFIMTSYPGYEGYPRVLVEALASGLPSVVTNGSDTGGIVIDGVNGFVTSRDPKEIADAVRLASNLSPTDAMESVSHLSAPTVVRAVMRLSSVSS